MRNFIATAVLFALLQGCSGDTAKRLTYESVQIMQQQECSKDLTTPCPQRQSYDDYQIKKKAERENKDKKSDQ